MTKRSDCIQDDNGTWSAGHCAVWVEQMANEDGSRQVVMLRHPDYPFRAAIKDDGDPASLAAGLRTVGCEYLLRVRERAGIDASVIDSLQSDSGAGFRWLALSWGAGEPPARDPRHSFWVARHGGGAGGDRTAVLLAGQRDADGRGLGGEIGLRVVMHVPVVAVQGEWRVRVTGVSMSNLPRADNLESIGVLALQALDVYLAPLQSQFRFSRQPAIHGVALLADPPVARVRIFGAGSSGGDEGTERRSYSFVSELDADDQDGSTARTVARLERLSHAHVFRRDPSSSDSPVPVSLLQRRPTRPAAFLDRFRNPTMRLPAERAPGAGKIRLLNNHFEVRQTRVGNDNGDPTAVQAVPVARHELRSDDLAAVHAFTRGRELFDRLAAYGIDAVEYFKLAKLPLLLRHRAPIRRAGDSKTVNAQVRPCDDGLSLLDDWAGFGPGDPRTSLEVCFGAGNLLHRSLLPNDAQRLRAQPLGLAADPRWAWHEFGHVLVFAGTGALEFRFAHSAGDALAAIVADPDSVLTRNGRGYDSDATYPWVHIVRRHNRDAGLGWCWCGQRNVARLATANALDDRRLGYFQEQLLSSSLFRLYRCIGGDTFADREMRRAASDYTVYLIMRAIALLGPEFVVPARTADQLVSALIDADIGTGVWAVSANWPEGDPPRKLRRVGGCVHKVVRWAFEMQGLYATDDPLQVAEGQGLSPPVDIYIADRRGGAVGGYEPVPLQWDAAVPQPWHASEQGIKTTAGKVIVTVGNRGRTIARKVRVAARVSPAGASPSWTALRPSSRQPCDVPVGAAVDFEFSAPASGESAAPRLVWAVATCAADRATYDPAAGLPCSTAPTPLVDLIANDNNQGLCIVA